MDPIVSTAWLAERLKEPDLRIVDAPFYMPGDVRTPQGEFEKEHIPGAVLFDLEEISDHDNPLPHMLAPANAFAQAVGRLGISDGDRIVVYDHMGLLSAARVWWNFRAMGHDEVYVLDGGLPRWIAEGRSLTDGPVKPVPQVFTPVYRPALVRDLRQVEQALAAGEQVLDYCAGGGGKTLAMSAAMDNKGQIHAYDTDRKRLAPIIERLKRAGTRNVQVHDDKSALDALRDRCDKVLVDAVGDSQPVYFESMPKGEEGNRRAEIFLQG